MMCFSNISVISLIQSTERVTTTGIIIRTENKEKTNIIKKVSPPPPEPKVKIVIYEDFQCKQPLYYIHWGQIEQGKSTKRVIYLKNTGETSVNIRLITENWSSQNAQDNIILISENYMNEIKPNEIISIELLLEIKKECPPMSNFKFDIIIIGT
jgi:hypothetical protein